jgi:hypothetical protein
MKSGGSGDVAKRQDREERDGRVDVDVDVGVWIGWMADGSSEPSRQGQMLANQQSAEPDRP